MLHEPFSTLVVRRAHLCCFFNRDMDEARILAQATGVAGFSLHDGPVDSLAYLHRAPNVQSCEGEFVNQLVETAYQFALKAHGEQRYGQLPYIVHLQDVAATLWHYGYVDDDIQAAGYLHDVVEDTGVQIDTIRKQFGDGVGDLVWAVTSAQGPNRKARNTATYPKIRATPRATALKLADRIANVTYGLASNSVQVDMYRKEMAEFRRALKIEGQDDELWGRLEDLLA